MSWQHESRWGWYRRGGYAQPPPPADLVAAERCYGTPPCDRLDLAAGPPPWHTADLAQCWALSTLGCWWALCNGCAMRWRSSDRPPARVTNRRTAGHVAAGLDPDDRTRTTCACCAEIRRGDRAREAAKYAGALTRAGHPPPPGWPPGPLTVYPGDGTPMQIPWRPVELPGEAPPRA